MTSPPIPPGNEMSARAARSFLASNDTGVLALGAENRGYGFPVSYTYEAETDRIILGFVLSPDTKKGEYARTTDKATFTVYTYDDVDSWTSVIARGPIHSMDGDGQDYTVPNLFFTRDVDDLSTEERIVDLDAFDRTWFELQVDSISGRYSER